MGRRPKRTAKKSLGIANNGVARTTKRLMTCTITGIFFLVGVERDCDVPMPGMSGIPSSLPVRLVRRYAN